jgi:hypothetical protein
MTAIELRILFVVGLILMTVASLVVAAEVGSLVRATGGARAGRGLRRRRLVSRTAEGR